MADIADLGFKVDTSQLKDGKAALDALSPAASNAEAASNKLTGSLKNTATAADMAARGLKNAGSASNASAGGAFRMAEGYDILTGKMNSALLAGNKAMASMRGMSGDVDKVGASLKLTAREGLGFSRQFADIGVTAAMGMSPFMIALQQGPQLFDIIQEKAIQTGTSVGAVMRALGAQLWAALAPILPIILAIGAAIGAIAAAFGLATRAINQGNGDIAAGLGLSEKQMKKLEKAGVDTSVTIGDTFKATFEVLGERLVSAFDGPLKWLKDAWDATLNFITKVVVMGVKGIIAAFTGAVFAIRAAWSKLPAAIGNIVISAANMVISGVEFMINKSIQGLNKLISFANMAAEKAGLTGFSTVDEVKLGRFTNKYEGAGVEFGKALSTGMGKGMKAGVGAVDRFFNDVSARARKNRKDAILEAAGPGAKEHKDAKGPKTDAEKFADLVTGANADIAKEVARGKAAAIDMTVEAAAKLEYQTKLVNEAESKGIKLTDAMRLKIDALATSYAKAKIAADNAVALRDVLKTADADLAGVQAQIDLIGKYGRELAYATEMAKLLADAKQKNMTADAIAAAMPAFKLKANSVAAAAATRDQLQFMEDQRRSSAERIRSLQDEQAALGLSADAQTRLRIENEMFASARQRNIDLTPADIESLKNMAQSQADLENRIRKTRDALDFTKATVKGFFADIRSGIEQGKGIWDTFADAAVNAIDRILTKLLDAQLDNLITSLFSSIGGGGGAGLFNGGAGEAGGFAKGDIFGFAKGDAFTNKIFNRPTAFAFGKGGAHLGVMGEAGSEAVMPLQRGPDGSLGVQMYGDSGGKGGRGDVNVNNYYTLTGALSTDDVININRQAAEQTKRDVKRSISGWIDEIQHNGGTV